MKIELDEDAKKFIDQCVKRNQGIPAERFVAFTLPSLINGKRVPATTVKANVASDPRKQSEYKPS